MATKPNPGKQFEADFKNSVPHDVYCDRLTESGAGGIGFNEDKRFSPKATCDFYLYKNPLLYALELKSTQNTSISFKGSSPMIKDHQLKSLRKAAVKGVRAGFIFNFRKSNNTYYLSIQDFDTITDYQMCLKSSISEIDIAKSGKAIKIEQRLKKVNYSYNLSPLFE